MLQVSTALNPPAEVYLGHAAPPVGPDPAVIRRAAADLVAQNQTAQAVALVTQGLSVYPDSEDLLVMRALISEMRHDWLDAAQTLEHLVAVQGQGAPAETWCHWVRALRCLGDWNKAFDVAKRALSTYADHAMLVSEWQTLNSAPRASIRKAAA